MTSFEIRKSSLVRAIRAARAASDMAWISAKESGVVISNSNMKNTVAATVKMVNLDNYKYDKNGVQHIVSLDEVSRVLETLKGSKFEVSIGNNVLCIGSVEISYSEDRSIPIPPDFDGIRPLLQKDIMFPTSILLDFISNTISMWKDGDRSSRLVKISTESKKLSFEYKRNWENEKDISLIRLVDLDKTNLDIITTFDAALLLKMTKSFPNKSKISMRWYKDLVGEFVINLDENCSVIVDIAQIIFEE